MNTLDPEEILKQQEKEKLRRERDLNDLRWVLSDPRGQRVMWRLLCKAGIFRSCFTGNSSTFYNEGRSDFGRYILSEIQEADIDAFPKMMRNFWSEQQDEMQNKED